MTELNENNQLIILDKINVEVCPREDKRIEEMALSVNGYTMERLKELKKDEDGFNEFLLFLRKHINRYNKFDKCILAGYNNIHFDNNFLRRWFTDNNSKYYGSYFWSTTIDVLAEATRYLLHYRPALENMKLKTIAKAVGIKIDEDRLHDALYDIELTITIFETILNDCYIKPFDQQKIEELKLTLIEEKIAEKQKVIIHCK
jgi:DNA polymerase-3 subunit epsilon